MRFTRMGSQTVSMRSPRLIYLAVAVVLSVTGFALTRFLADRSSPGLGETVIIPAGSSDATTPTTPQPSSVPTTPPTGPTTPRPSTVPSMPRTASTAPTKPGADPVRPVAPPTAGDDDDDDDSGGDGDD